MEHNIELQVKVPAFRIICQIFLENGNLFNKHYQNSLQRQALFI
ncbi:hypothetical protein GXM_05124 [Nostoc sphaeroides CCNUC1]|uniref:Uncharacterized protein n=1 Tax=Nostoc sphaeroides CCNUC1 TaxID=2653204 RepID=A0A5P8W4U1_9NOSO|nr:hypothetical protein GXM_05124 [Nostoc sphaeroides CCNUC1]